MAHNLAYVAVDSVVMGDGSGTHFVVLFALAGGSMLGLISLLVHNLASCKVEDKLVWKLNLEDK